MPSYLIIVIMLTRSRARALAAAAAPDVVSPPVFRPGPGDPYKPTDEQLKTTFRISGAAENLRTLYKLSKVCAIYYMIILLSCIII